MKQQILFIKWWEVRENYKSELDCVKKWEYDPYKIKKRWNMDLGEKLWEGYEIMFPISGLNKMWSDYAIWKILFEKSFPYLRDWIILIAHSLWWTFLAKYINENNFPVEIKNILLVAPAFKDSNKELLGSFNFDIKLKELKKYQDKITLYYSLDDFIIDPSDFDDFKKALPEIKYKEFNDRGHFLWEKFPEIIEDIKKMKVKER